MQNLIKDGLSVSSDDWQIYEAGDEQGLPGHALLPVTFWNDHGKELLQSTLPFGAVIKADEGIGVLLPFLDKIQVIAIEFSKFADGRGFSLARQLRTLHGYQGEIRAFGDVMPDQLPFLTRCGFNAVACRTESERDIALQLVDAVTVTYQADATEPQPLYRRR